MILPGEKIGSEEEYESGNGIYIANGELASMYFGNLDLAQKKASVSTKDSITPIKPGLQIIGMVMDVIEPVALMIFRANSKRTVETSDYAAIHVSRITNSYMSEVKAAFKPGDIVLAKVSRIEKGIDATTNAPELGVILAYCSRCKSPMEVKDRKVHCRDCDSYEQRKISTKYGKFDEVLSWQKNVK